MVNTKFVDLFEKKKKFCFSIFLSYLVYFGGKIECFLFTKTFFMHKTRTIGRKWLDNEHVISL